MLEVSQRKNLWYLTFNIQSCNKNPTPLESTPNAVPNQITLHPVKGDAVTPPLTHGNGRPRPSPPLSTRRSGLETGALRQRSSPHLITDQRIAVASLIRRSNTAPSPHHLATEHHPVSPASTPKIHSDSANNATRSRLRRRLGAHRCGLQRRRTLCGLGEALILWVVVGLKRRGIDLVGLCGFEEKRKPFGGFLWV